MTSPFTCVTCHVMFQNLETQRQHYKSDWHRYNLKRKVAELSPATIEEFQKRVSIAKQCTKQSNDAQSLYCNICRKKFNTQNQYNNHLVSKKHKENSVKHKDNNRELLQGTENINDDILLRFNNSVLMKGEIRVVSHSSKTTSAEDEIKIDSDIESINSDEWIKDIDNPINNNDCLFCNHHSQSLVRNLKHMMMAHSFFIPDFEYCIDIKGLLTYLGQKIFAGYMCIWCNNSRTFQSANAARTHMIDKGHCMMLHMDETLIEYTEFYDYSSSYPDIKYNDNLDAEVELPVELNDEDYQLTLPSGKIVGHRSLMTYYKQNLVPNTTVTVCKSKKLHKILLHDKALGSMDTLKKAIMQRNQDIKYRWRIQTKYLTQLQFKANKLQCYVKKQINC